MPDLRLASMDLDATGRPQIVVEETMDVKCDIVEESENMLANELRLNCAKGRVLTQSPEHGHQKIALLFLFFLMNLVYRAFNFLPKIRKWVAVALQHKRKDRITTFNGT